ncbi:hypothetical protein PIB30_067974 [Stylosanthes scabra]|uniref:Pectate lyase n=1 Tax=Stylosanthes scabra TaxID=79078 RepID=A0ABU6VLA3_9FABA|nr:hypothetical protein [Stylosanthes scabra]
MEFSFLLIFQFLLLGPALISSSPVQDPESVVHELHKITNDSRRNLAYFSCGTGNPIDDCWRCDPNWESNRKRLADCVVGFGRRTIGGRDGKYYVVTDPSDHPMNPRPGTLRHGHSDSNEEEDKNMQVTVAFNHFGEGLGGRMPRCRFGYFHVVNNDYTHWQQYAIGGSSSPTIFSQGNRFLAPPDVDHKEVTKHFGSSKKEWKRWNWRSEGDLMLNGAFFTESGDGEAFLYEKASSMEGRPAKFVTSITAGAGALACKKGQLC